MFRDPSGNTAHCAVSSMRALGNRTLWFPTSPPPTGYRTMFGTTLDCAAALRKVTSRVADRGSSMCSQVRRNEGRSGLRVRNRRSRAASWPHGRAARGLRSVHEGTARTRPHHRLRARRHGLRNGEIATTSRTLRPKRWAFCDGAQRRINTTTRCCAIMLSGLRIRPRHVVEHAPYLAVRSPTLGRYWPKLVKLGRIWPKSPRTLFNTSDQTLKPNLAHPQSMGNALPHAFHRIAGRIIVQHGGLRCATGPDKLLRCATG